MTDLVQRLRDLARGNRSQGKSAEWPNLLADEIEQLRARVTALEKRTPRIISNADR